MRGGRLMPAPGESADFPALIPPMLAVPARELPAPEAEWAAEFKWDGLRAVAYVSAGGLRLVHHRVMPVHCWPACSVRDEARDAAVLGGIGVVRA